MPRKCHTAEDIWGSIIVGSPDECWPWFRSLSTSGYGQFFFNKRLHTAHRVTWELANGPVPEGLQLDHLCRNRRCCNPSHLEPVTGLENIRRSPLCNGSRTHCPQGHPYDADNVMINSVSKSRMCRTCNYADSNARKRRRRAAFKAQGLTTRGTVPIYRPQSAKDGGTGCPGTAGRRK